MKLVQQFRFAFYFALLMHVLIAYSASGQVAVSVDWQIVGGSVLDRQYGINLWNGTDPAKAASSAYQTNIEILSPGVARLHAAEIINPGNPKVWIDVFGNWDTPHDLIAHRGTLAELYPHDQTSKTAPGAVDLYRRLLAAQPRQSVTIVTVGFLNALEALSKSSPDQFSSMTGKELVMAKVNRLVVMGCIFPGGGYSPNLSGSQNPNAVIPAVGQAESFVTRHWPTPIVFCGHEIGFSIMSGQGLARADESSPVRKAYSLYLGGHLSAGHKSWDQATVLIAVCGAAPWWSLSASGSLEVDFAGNATWFESSEGTARYVKRRLPDTQIGEHIDQLMMQAPGD